ncbi:MAG: DUF58 domain-containing protein [Chloroflexota bacterium]
MLSPSTRSSDPASRSAELLDPRFLARLEQLALVSKKVFTGQLKGEKRSTRRGTSVEFADYRNYSAGDDLRYIDWNTYARLDKLFLKLFIEEEDLHVYLLVDCSRSMAYGTPIKLEYARRAAAALGYIGLVNYDRVALTPFSDALGPTIGPYRGRPHVMQYFRDLQRLEAGGQTRFGPTLREFALRTKRAGVLILISDFFDPDYAEGLRALLSRRFQVSVIHLFDDAELAPGFVGDLKLIDAETGETREISITPSLLRDYQRTVENFCGGLQSFCGRYGMDYIRATTSTPFDDLILRYLRRAGLVK